MKWDWMLSTMNGLVARVWQTGETVCGNACPTYDGLWDAGHLGCGELVMDLRILLRAGPGKILKLVARDPGASADIPAFCRMTGHQLLWERPDLAAYWIRAKD